MKLRLTAVVLCLQATAAQAAGTCPKPLQAALRLVVVSTATMDTSTARLRLYKRETVDQPWAADDAAFPVVVGKAGLAWGNGFTQRADRGEKAKIEGDLRTPAGIFPIGTTFGFTPQSYPGHVVLKADETVCVDDPQSPNYNRILSRKDAGQVASAEDMRAIPLYRKGVVVDYASDRERKTGSCIFLHVWRSAHDGTSGCVAMPEKAVERVQAFTREPSALVVLPTTALANFRDCLPGVADDHDKKS